MLTTNANNVLKNNEKSKSSHIKFNKTNILKAAAKEKGRLSPFFHSSVTLIMSVTLIIIITVKLLSISHQIKKKIMPELIKAEDNN